MGISVSPNSDSMGPGTSGVRWSGAECPLFLQLAGLLRSLLHVWRLPVLPVIILLFARTDSSGVLVVSPPNVLRA
jgi:hypothetical protein